MLKTWNFFFVLIWISLLISGGIHLFSKGFLLTRVSQTEFSTGRFFHNLTCFDQEVECNDEQKALEILKNINISSDITLPKRSKVILLVIDALKYDFGVYDPENKNPKNYENNLPIMYELLRKKENTRLMKFVADPPTTTLQRLKGLTTGSLPTFIDMGSNFATPEINEDNIIDQILKNNLTSVFMGDSTWIELFPKRFTRQYPFPSFNIYDLDTVDKAILNILPKELEKNNWDLLVAHFLGVDHCGHKHGPLHPEMKRKLSEMDDVIRDVVKKMDDETTLIVIGDHGMTLTGDHGGDSEDEVNALLFLHSKKTVISNDFQDDAKTMQQIDLVPTLAAILGVPIPFSNLGTVNLNLLPELNLSGFSKYQILLMHAWQNAKQMHKYFESYAVSHKGTFQYEYLEELENKFKVLTHRANSIYTEAAFKNFAKDLRSHLQEILVSCREIWVKFDDNLMFQGLITVFLTVFFSFLLINNLKVGQLERVFNKNVLYFIFMSNIAAGTASFVLNDLKFTDSVLYNGIFYSCMLSNFLLAFLVLQNWADISENWSAAGRFSNIFLRGVFLIFISIFFSNSFIIDEQKILCYMLMGLIAYSLYELKDMIKVDSKNKIKWNIFFQSIFLKLLFLTFLALTALRFSQYYFKCREEQGNCQQFSNTSTNDVKNKKKSSSSDIVPIVIMALFATISRLFLRSNGNLAGYSLNVLLSKYGPIVGTISTAGHFLLSQGIYRGVHQNHIDGLAWVVYGLFGLQIAILLIHPLMIYILPREQQSLNMMGGYNYENLVPQIFRQMRGNYFKDTEREDIPIVCGLATVYSSVVISFGVLLTILLAMLLGKNAAAGIFISVLIGFVILTISGFKRATSKTVESCLQPPLLTLMAWIILIHYAFYATSHQPTMSQIDWHAAFVGRTAKFDNSNIISATLVILATFSGSILFSALYSLLNIVPFIIFGIMPATINRNEEKKLFNDIEYVPITVAKVEESEDFALNVTRGELNLFENEKLLIGSAFKTACQLFMLQGLRIFCSMLACTIHCRHLMVWKIFAPSFIYEGISTYSSFIATAIGYLIVVRVHTAVSNFITKVQKSE